MNFKDSKNKKIILFSLTSLIVGVAIGYFCFEIVGKTKYFSSDMNGSGCISGLTLIRPSLDCSVSDQKLVQLSNLQKKLEVLIDAYKKSGKADRVGVFVRDIKTTRFVGINDNDEFAMASLLKLPVLVGAFKLAEVQPKILEQEILYDGSIDEYKDQNYLIGSKLVAGQKYTILDLLTRSIENSDNTATRLVSNFFAPGYLSLILEAYGIKIKEPGQTEDYISPRDYASIFRSLYSASYLTREYSNQALTLLTKVKFDQGAVAKLPKNVIVAHKFGERSDFNQETNTNSKQLHDCGIVYAKDSNGPYIFCIMTQGKDFKDLEEVLQDVSFEIYDTMSSDKK